MKLNPLALGMMLGSLAAAPALAQYSTPQAGNAPQANQAGSRQAPAAPANQPKVSKQASKALSDLQKAVNAKDTANIPALVAAAQAKVKTADDRFALAQFRLKAAVDANDKAGIISGLQATIDSGFLSPAENVSNYFNLGRLHFEAKAFDPAAAAFEQVLKADPNHVDATVMLAESRKGQGRIAEAVSLVEKAIAAKTAAGQKADESWYKRAVALGLDAKVPNLANLTQQWVAAYPNPKSWRDAIRIYQNSAQLDDNALLDTMRLARATGALAGESDYFRYTDLLVKKGFPGEAKAVLDQGFAASSISKSRATFAQLHSLASSRAQGDQASLEAAAKTALVAANARQAMVTAEAYYGYGDYAKAAELYRAALTKEGVDKDLANLRLGMALARAGDKAGAEAALKAAGGSRTDVAKLWLTYVATKA
jgi:tetratricopeptide (TPR) repeat protein